MQTIADSLRAEGVPLGMARGLTLYLETRFGDLQEEVRDRIGTADVSQLNRWTVNAPTLEAKFAEDNED